MYRLLSAETEVREQRQSSRNAKSAKPTVMTTAPNQAWSWDITKLPACRWGYYYFYVVIDLYSRMIVGWTVAETESAKLAEKLLNTACWEQSIEPNQLLIHSDRGSPMKSKQVSQLLVDLGVAKSLSRPHVSNDNAFSEANFKTLKSRPQFPDSFESLAEAEAYLGVLVEWYNYKHKHGGIAHMTPATVHLGKAAECLRSRQSVLSKAFEAHPERFVKGMPTVRQLSTVVGINLPKDIETQVTATIFAGNAAVGFR
jgi:putative transposase